MGKHTMATKLPRKLEENMKVVGEQIRLARLGVILAGLRSLNAQCARS